MKKTVLVAIALALGVGWVIRPSNGLTHVTTTNTVIFDREIVRILDAHCVACHAEEGPASPLVTYEETWLNRVPILTAILARHMPPWSAVPGYGEFANDNGLTLREMQFVTSWVEGLGPRNAGEVFLNVGAGVAADVTAERADVRSDAGEGEWELGDPSLVRPVGPGGVEPEQPERVERMVVELGLIAERRLRGLEFRPGDRRVVRAADFFIEETDQWLGSWTPWYGSTVFPLGVGYRLPAGANLRAEIHYGTSSERVVDGSTLGLFLLDESAEFSPLSELVLEVRGQIPPGVAMERFAAQAPIGKDTRLLSLLPRFEPGIRSLEVSVRRADGGTDILLFAQDIPLEWPTPYIFKEPVLVERGSILQATTYYENGSNAPEPGGFHLRVSRY